MKGKKDPSNPLSPLKWGSDLEEEKEKGKEDGEIA